MLVIISQFENFGLCARKWESFVTDKRYFAEPLIFDFIAQVLEALPNEDGTSVLVLDKTYFYPTGGGQSCDKGFIAGLPVLDVRMENGKVMHQVQGQVALGEVACQVDSAYRLRNMQAHTGQHILSAAFLNTFNADTLAVKMNAEGLSTVDIALGDLSPAQIDEVENLCNQVIFENRAVKSYFVAPDSPKLEELRRAVKFEKVTGDVRLVEIENFDLVACAGTHFPSTGQLGILKILKSEHYKGGSRLYFATGYEALAHFRQEHRIIESLASSLSASFEAIHPLVQKLQTERQDLSKQIETMRESLLSYEVGDLVSNASNMGSYHLIKASFEERNGDELRVLGNLLAAESTMAAILVNRAGADVTVMVAAASDTGLNAGTILKDLLGRFGGRGGGRETYAQGVLKNFEDVSALMQAVDEVF
jgi:alanyl-tRNA synthetase